MTTQLLLESKCTFIGLTNYEYTHIKIVNKGISIFDLTRKEAENVKLEEHLTRVPAEECDNFKLGWIYTDGKFKNYVNKHPKIKERLLKLIDKL